MTAASNIKTIECPYCGNTITLLISSSSIGLGLFFSLPKLGGAGGSANFSLDNVGKSTTMSGYKISCDFCKRKYIYYDFNGKYGSVLSMLNFTESVVSWFKSNDVNFEHLGDIIIGITEPKDKVYQNFTTRLIRKLKRAKPKYKYVEIIFKDNISGKERRGVLVGRMKLKPPYEINIEYYYWSTVW